MTIIRTKTQMVAVTRTRALDKAASTAILTKDLNGAKIHVENEFIGILATKILTLALIEPETYGPRIEMETRVPLRTRTETEVSFTTPGRAKDAFIKIQTQEGNGTRIRMASDITAYTQ